MEEEILHQLIDGLYCYLQGFNHPWCKVSSIPGTGAELWKTLPQCCRSSFSDGGAGLGPKNHLAARLTMGGDREAKGLYPLLGW